MRSLDSFNKEIYSTVFTLQTGMASFFSREYDGEIKGGGAGVYTDRLAD